jgi:hypothetical protein
VERDPGLARAWALGHVSATALWMGGLYAAIAGWEPGAGLLVFGLTVETFSSLAIGVAYYRRSMRRPWPPVQPLPADDDW